MVNSIQDTQTPIKRPTLIKRPPPISPRMVLSRVGFDCMVRYRPFRNSTGNWGEFQIVANRETDHMNDHVEVSHLTKFHAFRVNRDQVMDLETWFKNPYKRL